MRRNLLNPPTPSLHQSGSGRGPPVRQEPVAGADGSPSRTSRGRTRTISAADDTVSSLLKYPSNSINPMYDDYSLYPDAVGQARPSPAVPSSFPLAAAATARTSTEEDPNPLVEVPLVSTCPATMPASASTEHRQPHVQPQPSAAVQGTAANSTGVSLLYHSTMYNYNLETGMLERDGRAAEGSKASKVFVEDRNTGYFHRVQSEPASCCCCTPLCWPYQQQLEQQAWQQGTVTSSSPSSFKHVVDTAASWLTAVGLCAQGLLGGLALLGVLMTYCVYASAPLVSFLQYYGPLALGLNRAYYVLISASLISTFTRYAVNRLAASHPSALRMRMLDLLAVGAYTAAYVANIIATPTEDMLSYEYSRDPVFWQQVQQLGQGFHMRLQLWHVLNVVRLAACGAAWLLVCYRLSPTVLHSELARDQARLAAARELGLLGPR